MRLRAHSGNFCAADRRNGSPVGYAARQGFCEEPAVRRRAFHACSVGLGQEFSVAASFPRQIRRPGADMVRRPRRAEAEGDGFGAKRPGRVSLSGVRPGPLSMLLQFCGAFSSVMTSSVPLSTPISASAAVKSLPMPSGNSGVSVAPSRGYFAPRIYTPSQGPPKANTESLPGARFTRIPPFRTACTRTRPSHSAACAPCSARYSRV